MEKRLTKSNTNKMLSGVLGGIGEYFGIDPTLVRVGYAALTVFSAGFPGLLLYIVLALIIPKQI
ncbi:MAG: PspC domain-containing protein [Prevotella sp.]